MHNFITYRVTITIIFALWWFYFDWPVRGMLDSLRRAAIWGYEHLFVFASAAAIGAGLAVEIDRTRHAAEIEPWVSGATVAVPVATFLIALWALHLTPRTTSRLKLLLVPAFAVLILLTPLVTSQAALLTGILLATFLTVELVIRSRSKA
jgi:hypothetical protein